VAPVAAAPRKPKPAPRDDEWVDVTPPVPAPAPAPAPVAASPLDAEGGEQWEDVNAEWMDIAPPTPTPTPSPSAGVAARERLAARGLTPEDVKAGRGMTTPRDFRSIPAQQTDRGFWGELASALNPREIGAGIMGSTIRQGTDMFNALFNSEEAPEPVATASDITGVPDLPALYRESLRRGEANESTAGLYGGVAPLVAVLAGTGAGSAVRRTAPSRVLAAEADYGAATGATPPMASEMMDRGIVVSNPQAQATAAGTTAADLRRSITPRRDMGGKFQKLPPASAADAARRAEAASEARFQSNLQTLLEAMPQSGSTIGAVGRAVRRTAWRGGIGSWGLTSVGVPQSVAVTLAGTYGAAELGAEIVKTNAWRTASPIMRRRFNAALATGDVRGVAAVGALIVSKTTGDATSDTKHAKHEEMRRYLTGTGTDTSTSADGTERPRRPGAHVEWPLDPTGKDENADLLLRTPPSSLLPERFRNGRNVTYGTPLTKQITDRDTGERIPGLHGLFGRPFDPRPGPLPRNTVLIAADARDEAAAYAHETFHSIYAGDLTPAERASWKAQVDSSLDAFNRDLAAILYPPSGRAKVTGGEAIEKAAERHPKAIVTYNYQYQGDPERMYDEAFSELGGQYMANPSAFKKAYPKLYGWFRSTIGREFIGGQTGQSKGIRK
jgi:hypothetical protein